MMKDILFGDRDSLQNANHKSRHGKKRVLFICTGNLFRSRFAEAVFNHHAKQRRLGLRAFSRGLQTGMAKGRLSLHTKRGLRERGIKQRNTAPNRVQLRKADLLSAHYVVALDRREHREMIAEQFPEWVDGVSYWNVPDLAVAKPENVLPVIEREVIKLIDCLSAPSNPFLANVGRIETDGTPFSHALKERLCD
jgi:protein-tyrosine phosphatase